MVAVVSGSGLGLFNSSASSLGGDNAGNAQVGRGRDRFYVNTTTGNLVVQSVDETLAAIGLDYATVRTYNSQGFTDEDNGDQWRLGVHMRLSAVTGGTGVNTTGSRLTKTFGDGAEVVYTYNAARSRYEATDGDGADDFLNWNGSVWTWTDGSTRSTEEYALVAGVQRIRFSRDTDLNTVTYNYSGSLLTSINMANPGAITNNAQTVTFTYDPTNTTNLRSIGVTSWNGTVLATQTLTSYTYDSLQRLQTATVDLTPTNTSDNVTYTTTYSYDGTSKRIASITQSDGSSVAFTYVNVNGDYRLETVRDAESRITTFSYNDVLTSGGSQSTAPATGPITNQDTQNVPQNLIPTTLVHGEQQPGTPTPYTLTGTLTTPPGGSAWGTAAPLEAEPAGSTASAPQVAFDSNGNGFAVWTVSGGGANTLKVAQYTRSTNTWAAPVTLYTHATNTASASLAVDAGGNAIVAWLAGGALSVARYTGSWSSATLLVASGVTSPPKVAISGTRAALIWGQGSALTRSAYVSKFDGTFWSLSSTVDSQTSAVNELGITIDSLGNVIASWSQIEGSNVDPCVWTNQFRVSTNAWTGAVTRDPFSPAALSPQIATDANGNAFLSFYQGADTLVARYTRSTNTWATATVVDSLSGAVAQTSLAVDPSGNAVLAWVQDSGGANSVYAKVYNAATSTWGPVTLLENLTTAVTAGSLSTSIRGSYATAVWLQNDGTRNNTYAATFNGSAWSAATVIETSTQTPTAPSIATDSLGNASAVWIQSNGTAPSVYVNRFSAGAGGTPYYLVPAGATWQSIANTLYGINSAAAGTALQTAVLAVTPTQTINSGDHILQTSLPSPLQVPTTTTVPDYYLVPGTPSTPTWRSVAAIVYGLDSAAAGTALQTAMQSAYPGGVPGVGQRIFGLPASISVPTTITLPYYFYVVQSTDWATTLQAIYNNQDPGLIQAVQAYSGVQNLVVGTRLHVQQNQQYTVGGGSSGPAIYQRTTMQDALGLVTTYLKDAQGRLISVQTPAVGGASIETRYTYDPVTGNVATITEDPTGLNRVTTFTYDPNTGLLLSTRDSLGNTVSRTYNSFNQLETQTSYTGRSTSTTPSGAMVSRFVYDGTTTSESHLRFAISAEGRVTEHVYNANGERTTTYKYAASTYSGAYTEAALNTWATGQRGSALELTQYTYDFRSNLSTMTTWAATNASGGGTGPSSVTRFIYDQRGMLLTTVEARGEATATPTNDYATNYTYDGLGRVLTTSTWVSASETSRPIQSIVYDDANRRTVTTLANGLTRTATYNRSGDLVSVANGPAALGTTAYTYDADARLRVVTDATNVKSYIFYDALGRKIGTIDGDGSLVELIYNRAHQVIKTVRYATRLGSTTLGSLSTGSWSTVAFSTLRTEANPTATQAANQIARAVYDASGVLVFALEDTGGGVYTVTKNVYDGAGRLTDTFRYLSTQAIAASVDEVLPADITAAANSTTDRRTRFFYNNDDQLIGTLDAEGFLKENVYDAGGRLVTQIGYFSAVDGDKRDHLSLTTMRPGASGSTAQLDATRDLRTRYFYDAQGRKIGEFSKALLDGKGYLSEIVYDVAGHVSQSVRYAAELTDTAANDKTFATFKTEAGSAGHATSYTYDGLGQVLTETNFENTETAYTYDITGNVVAVTRSNNVSAEARTTRTRYDALGRVTHELTAEGAVVLAALPGGATQAQIDDVWTKYGVKYTYDDASRRTSASVRPNDSQTNTTYFYYDDDGRLRFELDALGRVTENRYDAFGQLTDRIVHWKSVSVASPQGGLLTTALIGTLTGAESANVHERTTYSYSTRGQLLSATTVGGATTGKTYNVFGEVDTSTVGGQAAISYTYDRRGLQKLTKRGSVTLEDRTFDAFGRLTTLVDRGNTKTFTYDRLGREMTSLESGDSGSRQISYDAFSRTTKVRDKLGNETGYQYDDTARTVTVTTQEGIVVSTVHNRHGETLSVTANGNTTSYLYDLNGHFTSASDNMGSLEGRAYDRTGRQTSATDARGTMTTFSYDAVDRMLTRIVDSAGLALTTTYAYDANTRVMTVTEPGNRVTRTEYDRDGRVAAVVTDAAGSKPFRTEYQYDAANNTTLVTEGVGAAAGTPIRRTQYMFDSAGRRTHEYIDPTSLGGTLNIHTEYRYDDKDNLVRTIDANGSSTWYVYDAQRRLQQTVDALGGVTQNSYDDEDRVIGTRRFATSVTTSGFSDAIALQAPGIAAGDHVKRTAYDRDGRAKYTLETLGTTGTPGNLTEQAVVTERAFDAAGNVTRTRMYKNAINVPVPWTTQSVADALTAAGNSTTTVHADDRIERMVYDVRGRLEIKIDGAGAATKYEYDANGNVTKTTQYAMTVPRDDVLRVWYVAGTNSSVSRYLGTFSAGDVVTATVRFKAPPDTSGAMFLGDAGGPDQYDNYVYTGPVYGNDGWQTLTLTWTMTHDDVSYVYLYGDRDGAQANGSHSVVYDDVRVTSVQRGTVLADDFTGTRGEWNATGPAPIETISFDDIGSDAQVRTLVSGLAASSDDRVTRFWYDRLDRQRFMVDAEGYLSETRYTDGARIEETYRYFNPPNVAANATTGDVASAITTNPLDRYERSEFDTAGRLALRVDALGQQESFVYDAVGNKTQFTNKKSSVWNYVYDANHRLIEERSPSVAITTVSEPSADGGNLSSSTASAEIVTRLEYDALGNVKKRIEAYGRTEQRETQYEYDQLGRQKKVSTPNVLVYWPGSNELVNAREETSVTLVSTTTYDVFGNAVLGQNAAGSYSHKAYDQLGRVVYEVDAELNVTSYQYDNFGNVTRLTRHLNKVSLTAPTTIAESATWSAADIAGHLTTSSVSDRFIATEYDRLNRPKRVVQPAAFNFHPTPGASPGGTTSSVGAETQNRYNAFGEVILQRQLFASPATWSDTYFYYDRIGQRTATIDPLGYFSSDRYDAVGNVTRHYEAAKPLVPGNWNDFSYRNVVATTPTSSVDDAAGYDRDFLYVYDRLDRKTEARQLYVETTSISGQSTSRSFVEQVTSYAYDAVGNQVRVRDHNGAETYTYYDVLGRVIAVAEPLRDTDGSGAITDITALTPLTLLRRNANGDLVEEFRYALGASSATLAGYTAAGTHANDRSTRILVDAFGRIRRTQDGMNANQFASYDKLGKVAKEWQPVVNVDGVTETLVTLHRYDKLGREITIIEPQKVGAGATNIWTQTRYNAFGEISAKGTNSSQIADGAPLAEYYEYDNAGRLWKTNSKGGADTVIFYDLMGNSTAEIRSLATNLRGYSLAQIVDIYNLAPSAAMRTETVYDKRGQVVEQRQPTFETGTGVDPIVATFAISFVDGPQNSAAIYQRQFADYGEGMGLQEYYVVNPLATLAQDGGWYLTGTGGYAQDSTHQIVSALRITWNAPTESGVNPTFQYRLLGSTNENDWASAPVGLLGGDKLGVAVNSLTNQNYEYRVRYQRASQTTFFAEAKGAFYVEGTSSASLGVNPIGADPAAEVAALPAVTNGGIVSWAAPSGSLTGLVATFRVAKPGVGWVNTTATLSGATFSADLRSTLATAGTFTYEVVYQRDGVTVATHTGSLYSYGLVNDRQITVNNHDDTAPAPLVDVIGTPTPLNAGQVGAVVGPTQDYNLNLGWQGTNTITFNWGDIGPGRVRIHIDYKSEDYDKWNSSHTDTIFVPGETVTDRILTIQADGAARTGATLSFGTFTQPSGKIVGGVAQLLAVRVYREVAGVFQLAYTQSNPTAQYGRTLTWSYPPAGFPGFWAASFEYAPLGTSNYSPAPLTVGIPMVAGLNNIVSGNYSYRIRYSTGNRVYSEQLGTFSIATNGTVTTSLGSNQPIPAVKFIASNSLDQIYWTGTPESGSTVQLTYTYTGVSSGGGTVNLTPTSGSNYSYRFSDVVNSGLTQVTYSIQYLRPGETTGYIYASGRLGLTIVNVAVQPRIDIQTQTPVYPSGVQAIPAATGLSNRYITWSPQAAAGAAVEFHYRLPNTSTWTVLDAAVVSGGYRVDTLAVANSTYEYEITYTNPGQSNPYARGRGQFTVNRTSSVGTYSINPTPAGSPTLVQRTPRQLQTVDRWGNVITATDTAGNTTNYRYTVLGGVAQVTQPQVEIVSTAGGNAVVTAPSAAFAPKLYNYFDALGRVVGTRDANGNVNSLWVNAAGQNIRENHADGGSKILVYDAFGNVFVTYDELLWATVYTYNRANRLTQISQDVSAGVSITKQFFYDEAGRRIRETTGDTSPVGDGDGGVESIRYLYDLAGNLTQRRTELGYTTNYGYDVQGRKTSEVDAIGGSMSWTYDDFFVRTHTNLGSIVYTYNYNLAGLQTTQTGGGTSITNVYDWAGHLVTINDTAVGRVTSYTYDFAARRVREKTAIGSLTHQDTLIGYDTLGRISTLTDLRYDLKYSYDAQGNRTHISATYYDHQQAPKAQNLWYTYDSMNRVLISQGLNLFGVITTDSTTGVRMTYDLAGRRRTATQWGTQFINYRIRDVWMPNSQEMVTTERYQLRTQNYTDTYTYDGAGRLKYIDRSGEIEEYTAPPNAPATTVITPTTFRISDRTYDGASRMTNEIERSVERVDEIARFRTRTHTSVYDDDGRLASQTNTVDFGTQTTQKTETTISYNPDAAGVVRSYSVSVWDTVAGHTNSVKYTSNYVNTFRLADSYLDGGQSVSSTGSGGPTAGSTTRNYNVNNELISFIDSKDHRKNRYFANNANGQAMTVIQPITTETGATPDLSTAFQNALLRRDNATRSQHFFFANGQAVGSFGQLIDESGQFKANFDVNYQPISGSNPSSAPPSVIAQAGDTPRLIAARVYGDASLWYLVADENGFTGPDYNITEGTLVRLPNEVVSLSNNASTFKPFNPADALGDTTPTQPFPPPPKKGCGVIGMIIMVVVMVVVTIFTAGVAAGLAGTMGSSFGGIMSAGVSALGVGTATGSLGVMASMAVGAISSAVTQGIGMALGIQDKFDWGQVAMGAISAGVGAGLAKANLIATGSKVFNAAATAAISSTITQGISVAVGLQESFEWRSVAAAAAGAGVGAAVGKGLNGAFGSSMPGKIAQETVTRFAGGVAGAVVRGGKINYLGIAADSFGNALGNALVELAIRADAPTEREQQKSAAETAKGAPSADPKTGKPANVPGQLHNNPRGKTRASYGVEIEVVEEPVVPYDPSPREQKPFATSNGEPRWIDGGVERTGEVHPYTGTDIEPLKLDGYELSPYIDDAGVKAWGYMDGDTLRLFRAKPAEPPSPYEQREAALDERAKEISDYAESQRGSVIGDLWGNTAEIFGHGGNSMFRTLNFVGSLVDDGKFRSRIDATISHAVFHPIDTGVAAYNGAREGFANFYGLPLNEQMKKIGDMSFNYVADAGVGKAFDLAGGALLRTGKKLMGTGPSPRVLPRDIPPGAALVGEEGSQALMRLDDVAPLVDRPDLRTLGPAGSGQGQLTANSCGMAAGQRVLAGEGIPVFQSNLTRGFFRGLEPDKLAANMNRFSPGFVGHYTEMTPGQLSHLAQDGQFITRIGGNPGHFVVVESISRGTVKFFDPAGGVMRTRALDDFAPIVSGVVYKPRS